MPLVNPDAGRPRPEAAATERLLEAEIMTVINEAEARFPVDAWSVAGVQVWPLIRRQLYFRLLPVYGAAKRERTKLEAWLGSFSRVARMLRRIVALGISRSESSFDKVDAVFFNSSRYHDLIDGRWYATLCDPLREALAERKLSSLTLLSGWERPRPLWNDAVHVQLRILFARCKGFVRSLVPSFAPEPLPRLAEFREYLETIPAFAGAFDIRAIRRYAHEIRAIADDLKPALVAFGPKVGFVSCYYDTDKLAFNLACRELEIPTVDIQHGVQGPDHVAYGRWNRVPRAGYALLPSLFWCWRETDVRTIRAWNSGVTSRHDALVGGNLYFDRWARGGFAAEDAELTRLRAKCAAAVRVLVTLNGESRVEIENLIGLIRALEAEGASCFFWIRMHPLHRDEVGVLSERLKIAVRGDNYDVHAASFKPLPAILEATDVHVTEGSTVVIDADAFGVPSVITSDWGAATYPDYIATGKAVSAFGIAAAAAAVSRLSVGKKVKPESVGDGGAIEVVARLARGEGRNASSSLATARDGRRP